MIHPSYVELMKVVNNNVEFGEEPMADKVTCPKPLSIAVEELYEGKVKIIPDTENQD